MGGERRHPLMSSSAFNSRLKRVTKPGRPTKNQIKKSVNDLIACDLVGIAKALKKSNVCCISLHQKHAGLQKRKTENRKLKFLGYRHSEALFTFSRALAWALYGGGWLQELELGFALWERDLKILAESLSQSATLKRLSFANSEFGDHSLQILGRSLQECTQLEILNLSACALTDAVAPILMNVLKAHVCRKAQADWQASLRSSKGVHALTMRPKGLIALDISLNGLTDITTQTMCSVLRMGAPLQALNLKANRLTRISGKLLLDVMEERVILRFVDLRDNVDNRLMGVLEDGQHLTTFSRMQQALFWPATPSAKSKRASFKPSMKNTRGGSAWEAEKPYDDAYKSRTKVPTSKASVRPQSAPSSVPVNYQSKASPHRPPMVLSETMRRHVELRKNSPRSPALDLKSIKPQMRRPSTSPEKAQHGIGKRQPPASSCSTSPEFAAWEHDDSNTKENRVPFRMNQAHAVGQMERGLLDEDVPWKEAPRMKGATHIWSQDAMALRPLDVAKLDKSGENGPTRNVQDGQGGAKGGLSWKSKQLEAVPGSCNKTTVNKENQVKGGLMRSLPSKARPPSCAGIQMTEWNSFLKEITQAIFHLQERLDELIGPADPDSITERATSQLQVLC